MVTDKDKGMTLSEAIKQMNKGKKVQRENNIDCGYYLCIDCNFPSDLIRVVSKSTNDSSGWFATHEDLIADDWMVLYD